MKQLILNGILQITLRVFYSLFSKDSSKQRSKSSHRIATTHNNSVNTLPEIKGTDRWTDKISAVS